MWDLDDLSFAQDSFSGQARLFPLPNLVMFPNVMQPLHIFEPRYVQMVEDALANDRLIATCLLLPGKGRDDEGRPAIAPIACLGKIVSFQRQMDGTYNILLLGVRRAIVRRELASDRLYRQAEVELLSDVYPDRKAPAGDPFQTVPSGDDDMHQMQDELIAAFQRLLPKLPIETEPIEELIANHVTLGMLTDVIAYTLDIGLRAKQKLLSENRVVRRAEAVLKHVAVLAHPAETAGELRQEFPPKFSLN